MISSSNNRLNLIRTLSCCQCYAPPPSQAAHSNWSEHGKGKGIKADDEYTIPLCIFKWAYINQIPLITPDELKWVKN